MARPIRPWFRFYVEAFPDRKIRRLKPAQRWVWVAVLGAARESHEPGKLYVAPGLPMTRGELADYAAVTEREIDAALRAMIALSMVTVEDTSGLIEVTNWDKRQFESDNVTERTRDHRERSREQDRNVPKNVPGNTPERTRAFATETEAETEAETDNTSGVGRTKRATQLPGDWEPNDAHRELAVERRADLGDEVDKFRDWAAGNGATKKDWDATFRNWLRNARPTQRPASSTPARPHVSLIEAAPPGLTDEEYFEWEAAQRRRRQA